MPAPDYEYEQETWASDAPISLPDPPVAPGVVPMEGFVFTVDGICHDLTEVDIEHMTTPTYGPERAGHA